MNKKIRIIMLLGAFALFLILAYFLYSNLSNNYEPDKQDIVTSETKKLALDFTVLNQQGEKVKLSDFIGKPVVLNFWASWCPPCKSELPDFNEVYNQMNNEVVFMMVDLVDNQRETIDKAKKFIQSNGYNFPVYFDSEGQVAEDYNVSSIPVTFFINADGELAGSHKGILKKEELLNNINKLKESKK